jgi:hypothetical protein
VKKPTDDNHRAAMAGLSSVLKTHIFPDLKDTLYFDVTNPQRTASFASKLIPNNVIEALRSALSNVQHPCACHDDAHNDPHPNFSPVITFSIFLEIDGVVYRLALIGYSRKAIREYYERRNKPGPKLIGIVQQMLESLPLSRVGWTEPVKMINGILPENRVIRLGEAEFGYIGVKCHMNMFLYLSCWVHYASLLIGKFSLSYQEAVGLVIGMYCENNPLCFVLVAKDLLEAVDSIAKVSRVNFGLMVRVKMFKKRDWIRSKYRNVSFTFPQRFQNCWQDAWRSRMLDKKEFQKTIKKVASFCALYMESCSTLIHRTRRVEHYVELTNFLRINIFGVGDLISKHLVPILSILGLLPVWLSSMSHLKNSSDNYTSLVRKYQIGKSQGDADSFLRTLGFSIKRPMTPISSDDDQPQIAGAPPPGTTDRKVDILYAENVCCKFLRMLAHTDVKFHDLIFLGQYLYIPNVENQSITVMIPGQSNPKVIASGALHFWRPEKDKETVGGRSTLFRIPPEEKKLTRKDRNPEPDIRSVPRKMRKQGHTGVAKGVPADVVRAGAGVAKLPTQSSNSRKQAFLWIPNEIDRSRGLFKEKVMYNNTTIDTFQRHIEMIEHEGSIKSHLNIVTTSKDRRQSHTLESVIVNKREFRMADVNLSVVYALFNKKKTYTFGTRKEAVSFGHTFLLFMVYPGRWFQNLYGTPSGLMEEKTFLVKRKRHTDFYLTRTGENGWMITPETSNKTYEYT